MGHIHSKLEFAGSVTVGPKCQVVIPVEAREALGIKPGDKLIAIYSKDQTQQAVGFLTEAAIEDMLEKMDQHVSFLRQKIGRK